MQFDRNDENYVYGFIGKNVRKYRKAKGLTQAKLAEEANYSKQFISNIENNVHQTFSIGTLWRLSLILEVDMYKLCIDEEQEKLKPRFLPYTCENCGYHTDIPVELLDIVSKANSLNYQSKDVSPSFTCPVCNSKLTHKE